MRFKIDVSSKVILSFVVLAVLLALIFPRAPKLGYEYRKGSAWKYETLFAKFDFPILKTEEQLQEERSKSVSSIVPYYKYSEETVNKNLKAAEGLSLGKYASLKSGIVSIIREIYSQGVVPDEGVKLDRNSGDIESKVIYIQKNKHASKLPATEVYKLSDAKAKLLAELSGKYPGYKCDSILKANSVYDLIAPNLVYDKQTTDLVHTASGNEISPTMGLVNAGQLIVSEGEIVTAEIAQMLDSYKLEYEANLGYGGPKIWMWLGNILLAVLLCQIFFFSIWFTNRSIFQDTRKLLYLMMLVLIQSVMTLAVNKAGSQYLFLVPFTLTALWLQAFFRNRVIVVTYFVSLLPLLIFSHSGVALFVMYLLAGFVSIYAFQYFNRGWMQFITAFITFGVLLVTYFTFRMIDSISGNITQTVFYLFLGSLLTVLGYPLIYLFERMFNLVSNSRLMELGDTSNSLIRELEAKAPGTFQHSLQVMSMADFIARSIGANVLLVRAGALYHDIGKMVNPLCFIENEAASGNSGEKYHEHLSYRQSAKEIIAHVHDGLELAEKNGLPQIIKDFITTHHGTTCTAYFYNKYLNEGGDPNDVADFFYPGSKPSTKEQIIVMLCDTIEAASRTLSSSDPEARSQLVEKIVAAKMAEGQFDEVDISIKEINTVKESLKSYLSQLYHERVAYPNRKKR